MGKNPKQPRNWHAVNAFRRHAGPMKSRKRQEQVERNDTEQQVGDALRSAKEIKNELAELNSAMDLTMESETYAAAASQRDKLREELVQAEDRDERERHS